MSKDPAVLFYTSDFISGTLTMNDAQKGKYIILLCLQHQQGILSHEDMMNICKTYDEKIFKKFIKTEDGFYYNERMKFEADKRSKYSASRSTNRKNICKTYDEHMENENENENISKLLLNEIIKRKPDFKQPDLEKWAVNIELMIRVDKRPLEQIKKVILWCQQDQFWQNNILSTSKLRKQYDQLVLKMEATNGNTTGNQKPVSQFRGNFSTERERNNAAAGEEADIIRREYEAKLAAASGADRQKTG